MPTTTLQCPKCNGDVPDTSRGTFTLYGMHANYLCPHCESVLSWERPMRPLYHWLTVTSFIPVVSTESYAFWQYCQGTLPAEPPAWVLPVSCAPICFAYGLISVLRYFDPWILVVKRDPRELFWKWQAEELKIRSRPGSKW